MSEHTDTADMPDPKDDPTRKPGESAPLLSEWVEPTPEPWPAIPDYVLLAEIGRGGYGRVFSARSTLANTNVAIKVLRKGVMADDEDRARFRREIKALAKQKHAHIIPILHSGTCPAGDYFVMKHVLGETLLRHANTTRQSLSKNHSINAPADSAKMVSYRELAPALLPTLIDAIDAVACVHQCGIVHRDLKPENIMVENGTHAYLMDFGLAKPMTSLSDDSSGVTLTGEVPGTRPYMSPEQAFQEPLDARSDIYSIGVVLYRVLLNQFPYPGGDSFAEAADHIRKTPPKPPRGIDPTVPPDMERIMLKCLRKDREHRYESARQLVEDLREASKGRPIRVIVVPDRQETAARRRRNGLIAVAALLGLLAGAAMFYRAAALRERFASLLATGMLQRYEQPQSAAKALRQAIELNPDAIEPAAQLVLLLARQNKMDEAIALGEPLIARRPDDPSLAGVRHTLVKCYRWRGGEAAVAAAEKHAQWLAANVQRDSIEDLLSRAASAPQPADAIAYLTRALAQEPRHFEARFDRAQRYFALEKNDDALTDARRLTDDYPKTSRALNLLGGLLAQVAKSPEDFAEAEHVTAQAVALDPDFPPSRCNHAQALCHLRRFAEAIAEAQVIINADVSPAVTRTAYDIAIKSLAMQKKQNEALALCRTLAEWANLRLTRPRPLSVGPLTDELIAKELADIPKVQLESESVKTETPTAQTVAVLNSALAKASALTRLRRFSEAKKVLAPCTWEFARISVGLTRVSIDWAAADYDAAIERLASVLPLMQSAPEIESNDVANMALWMWMLRTIRNGPGDADAASEALALARSAFLTPDAGVLVLWCGGEISDDLVTAPVSDSTESDAVQAAELQARLFIAMRALARGDQSRAIRELRNGVEKCTGEFSEYTVAYATWRRLESQSAGNVGSPSNP